MSILIDGYNLLHVTGIVGSGIGPGTLERSRGALLNFIASTLPPDEVPRTTIVFDARDAPHGLPRELNHRGLKVMYASQYEDADELIEELIRSDSVPRQLVVVSSDNRIQRAARRRRATPVNSDIWYAEIIQQHRHRTGDKQPIEIKPDGPLSAEEVTAWLNEFGDVSSIDLASDKVNSTIGATATIEKHENKSEDQKEITDDLANPFPPGYAEDLLCDDVED